MAGGRPTLYSEELAAEICYRLSSGENMTDICHAAHMPDKVNVWRWKREREEFRNMINCAMQDKGECCADKVDVYKEMAINGEIDPSVAKLAIDTERWKASKFYPRMYGDKQIVESKNENLNHNMKIDLTESQKEILKRFGYNPE